MFKGKWTGLAIVGIAFLTMSAAAVVWVFAAGGSASAKVEFREEGNLVGLQSADEAFKSASEKVGFEVYPLGNLPGTGFGLVSVDAYTGPAGQLSPLKYADVNYRDASAGTDITLTQFNVRMQYPANDAGQQVSAGLPGVEVWVAGAEPRVIYTVFVGDRTYHLVIRGAAKMDQASVTRMIATLK